MKQTNAFDIAENSTLKNTHPHRAQSLAQLSVAFRTKSSFYAKEIRQARRQKCKQEVVKALRDKRSLMDKCANKAFNISTGHTPYDVEEFNELMQTYREY